jgi:hypothetical protein
VVAVPSGLSLTPLRTIIIKNKDYRSCVFFSLKCPSIEVGALIKSMETSKGKGDVPV